MLIRQLPVDSATQTALRDATEGEPVDPGLPAAQAPFGPWALTNYQLAALVDEVAALRFVVAKTGGAERYPKPEPMPRPGMHRPVRRQTRAVVAYLNRLRAGG